MSREVEPHNFAISAQRVHLHLAPRFTGNLVAEQTTERRRHGCSVESLLFFSLYLAVNCVTDLRLLHAADMYLSAWAELEGLICARSS